MSSFEFVDIPMLLSDVFISQKVWENLKQKKNKKWQE